MVSILHLWLWEPVTHEIWETAALSTIYSTAREKEKKLATPYTLQGRGGIIFSFAKEEKEESQPVLRRHICHCSDYDRPVWSRNACVISVVRGGLISLCIHFSFLAHKAKQMLGGSAGCGFVLLLCGDSNPSAAQHCFVQTAKNVSVLLGMQQHVLFCWR